MKPRLRISNEFGRMMAYPKFSGVTRMLVLETGYFFEQSWLRAAAQLGWEAASVPSAMVGGLSRDDIRVLLTTLGEFKPDFILASNYAGMDVEGLFARFFGDLRVPYVSWFTDTPRMILYDRAVDTPAYQVAAVWERHYEDHLRELGFEHVLFMPLATDPVLFNGAPREMCSRPLAFVGTSMVEQAAEAREKVASNPALIAAVDAALDAGRVSRAALASGLGAVIDAGILSGLGARDRRHAELYLIYETTRRQRAAMVDYLAPWSIEVRGDPCWASITPHAGGGIGYFADLAPYFQDTSINVNVTSVQMATAVNQRVFDCPAAGGFLLTDDQRDVEELFDPETEVAVFGSWEELEDKTQYYLTHPSARMPVVRNAKARIAAHHTHRHRLAMLDRYLRERFAG